MKSSVESQSKFHVESHVESSRIKKKVAGIVATLLVLLVLISASCVYAEGETQNIQVTLTPERQVASAAVSSSSDGDNDVVSSRVPELESRIRGLEVRRSVVVRHYLAGGRVNARSTANYNVELAEIDREIKLLQSQAFGGYANQQKVYKNLSEAGFITRGQADDRYQKKIPPAVPVKEKEMVILTWALVALALILLWVLFGRRNTAPTTVLCTVVDPAQYGTETAAHRQEIGAPNAPAASGESTVDGYRITGPGGTSSWERWRSVPNNGQLEANAQGSPQNSGGESAPMTVNHHYYGCGYLPGPGTTKERALGQGRIDEAPKPVPKEVAPQKDVVPAGTAVR